LPNQESSSPSVAGRLADRAASGVDAGVGGRYSALTSASAAPSKALTSPIVFESALSLSLAEAAISPSPPPPQAGSSEVAAANVISASQR
jgi:hypothetical protein